MFSGQKREDAGQIQQSRSVQLDEFSVASDDSERMQILVPETECRAELRN
jgi:hypothetical protein